MLAMSSITSILIRHERTLASHHAYPNNIISSSISYIEHITIPLSHDVILNMSHGPSQLILFNAFSLLSKLINRMILITLIHSGMAMHYINLTYEWPSKHLSLRGTNFHLDLSFFPTRIISCQ